MGKKVFVVFNTTSIGDVLVTNTLVQNIKYYYPDSKVVFICNTPMNDIAKYQNGVDDVISYNKSEIKSLKSILEFAKKFPYKKPFASFVTYSNERNLIISRLIGAKHIISHHKFFLWNTREKYKLQEYTHMKDRWGGMIEALTGEHKNLPIKYDAPELDTPVIQEFKKLQAPVLISPTSNFKPKDMNLNDCEKVVSLLDKEGFTPVLIGAGVISKTYTDELKELCKNKFIDIVNKTTFLELANIYKKSKGCISVDTGTMHFANALNTPVVEVFYHDISIPWSSDTTLYPARILNKENNSPDNIVKEFKELCEEAIYQ